MKPNCYLIAALVFLAGCTAREHQTLPNSFAPKKIRAEGRVLPFDLATARVVPVDESRLRKIPVGPLDVVPTNTNVTRAGEPKVIPMTVTELVVPGPPRLFSPAITSVPCGKPDVIIAKDAVGKDHNSHNFTCFKRLQGLKNDFITSLVQDQNGNLWFGSSGGGLSQYDGKRFSTYLTGQGLKSNRIRALLTDRNNRLWIGDDSGGLTRFDGKAFVHFSDTLLTGNVGEALLEDRAGNIWINLINGVIRYDQKEFTYFPLADDGTSILSFGEDRMGNIWIGTSRGDIIRYDGERFVQYKSKDPDRLLNVTGIKEDRRGNLWFVCLDGGALQYDGGRFSLYAKTEGLGDNYLKAVLEDRLGNLWFGTGEGLTKFDGTYFTFYTEADGLSYRSINCLLEDRYGNLWMGTNSGGLVRYEGKLFTHFNDYDGLSNKLIYGVSVDRNDQIWISTYGGGVNKYNGKSFTHYTSGTVISRNFVLGTTEDYLGNIWFATWGGGIGKFDGSTYTYLTAREGLTGNFIYCVAEDHNGNIWTGVSDGGICAYDGKSIRQLPRSDSFPFEFALCIFPDRAGNIWFGSLDQGVMRFDGHQFTQFDTRSGLPSNTVRGIAEDRDGNIWLATNGGAVQYDGESFTIFTEQQGLSGIEVVSILEDKSGTLWFGTNSGLNRLINDLPDENTGERELYFKSYTYEDGFLGVSCRSNSLAQAGDGAIWIGTVERLTVLHPEGELPDTIPPNIQLTSIDLFSEQIDWTGFGRNKDTSIILGNGVKVHNLRFDSLSAWYAVPDNLTLAYNNNYLTFNFLGITLKSPQKVKYQYKLDGIDEHWSALTNRTEAPYGNLPPGSYTFRVKAMNSEGHWSDEFHYAFTIRPPWWRTWWAYLLYFATLSTAAWYYIRSRERDLKTRQKLLERTVEKRTEEVIREKREVERQKERSEELLLNILPAEVAEELKQKGHAEAKYFENVTVMFTDFKDFTGISEKLTAAELVAEVDFFFKAFDEIVTRYHIEKIKTIGDSYMCACGLPMPNPSHAVLMVSAALEIQAFMRHYADQQRRNGRHAFEIRIGIHSGPVVAGVVGFKKFAYDIWGDTVNIASRMESSGMAGKVNISQTTCELVKENFRCLHRGKVVAKNKGKIDMYFVEPAAG